MKKLSIGLLAAIVLAIAAAPADAASKKKSSKAKKPAKAEVTAVADPAPLGSASCFLSTMFNSKSPGPGCGR
jgi:hypothetical protein